MTNAKVVGINNNKGRAIAITEAGEYVLIELLDDDIELYDIIRANFEFNPLASETITNVTQGCNLEVFIQDYANKEIALNYLNGR